MQARLMFLIIEKLHYSSAAAQLASARGEDEYEEAELQFVISLEVLDPLLLQLVKPLCLSEAKHCLDGTVHLLPFLEVLYFHFR